MNYNTKKIEEAAAKAAEDAKAIVDRALEEKREMTPDEEKQFDSFLAEHQKKENEANRLKKLNNIIVDKVEEVERIADTQKKSINQVEDEKLLRKQALKTLILKGDNGLNEKERSVLRAQSVGTGTAGGNFVPTDLANEIIKSLKNYGGMREVSHVFTTASGNALNFATSDNTTQVATLIGENTAASELDFVLGQKTMNAYKYESGIIRASNELFEDSFFDVEEYILEEFSKRFGRGLNAAYTTANGSSKPQGIRDASTLGVAAAAVAAITDLEMLALKHSVDRDYRVNGKWMFNDNTLLALKKTAITTAATNNSLWDGGVIAGNKTIDGDEYVINNDLPDMAAGAHSILYGDFKKFYIRDVAGIRIQKSTDLYMASDQIAFVGFMRTDSELMDSAAVKHIRMSNT